MRLFHSIETLLRQGPAALALALVMTLGACAGGGMLGGGTAAPRAQLSLQETAQAESDRVAGITRTTAGNRTSFRSLFTRGDDPNTTVKVNKYIWNAALEVLNFLPVQSVDPFTGVIVTGYGRPPGGGRAYRATIYVQDVALDARSLVLAMQVQGGGAVAPETIRAVEDAILTRARELRIQDARL